MTSDRLMLFHELNNLLGKIAGAAELGLLHGPDPRVRAELEVIVRLAEEGGSVIRRHGGERSPG